MRRLYYKKRHYQLSCKCTLRTPSNHGIEKSIRRPNRRDIMVQSSGIYSLW
uniref:Uncharacterized protein n=1 Tax=Anguilla anguilla TaxID=7936 RepID=A0A0E9TMU5_ANGAN